MISFHSRTLTFANSMFTFRFRGITCHNLMKLKPSIYIRRALRSAINERLMTSRLAKKGSELYERYHNITMQIARINDL